jgi:C4-dicarboxylate-specific signal transduction histidine kinase
LYDEASTADALDFRNHLQQCDACRREFTVFNQVHDSIQLWRTEALGASFNPAEVAYESVADSRQFVRHERRLSALAALREFFSVSPLWLRGATAFAALLLCVLGIVMIARVSRKPVQIAANDNDKRYTEQELKHEIDNAVNRTRAELTSRKDESMSTVDIKEEQRHSVKRTQMAANQPKNVQPRNLNRQEREQLAADLRVTLPADDEELLLALPEQDIPRQ